MKYLPNLPSFVLRLIGRDADAAPASVATDGETQVFLGHSLGLPQLELPQRDHPPKRSNTAETKQQDRLASLAASDARFQSLTLLGSDWHWDQDAQFRFTAVRGNLVDAIGASIHKHLGRTLWQLPQIEALEGGWGAHRQCLKAHRTFRDLVLRGLGEDGGVSYVSISGEPLHSSYSRRPSSRWPRNPG